MTVPEEYLAGLTDEERRAIARLVEEAAADKWGSLPVFAVVEKEVYLDDENRPCCRHCKEVVSRVTLGWRNTALIHLTHCTVRRVKRELVLSGA